MEQQKSSLSRAAYEAPAIRKISVAVEQGFCQSTEVGDQKEEFKQEVENEHWVEENGWL